MKINKEEALVLAKILHPHDSRSYPVAASQDGKSQFQLTLDEVCEKIEVFLLNATSQMEEDEEDEEEEQEDEEKSDLDTDFSINGDELHRLTPAKSTKGMVEIEYVVQANVVRVDLLLDGMLSLEDITHLRRSAKSLHVRSDEGEWHVFQVTKFPKGWSTNLPVEELVEVSA